MANELTLNATLAYADSETADLSLGIPADLLKTITTKKFVGDSDDHVKELHTVQVEWVKGNNGRPGLRENPGTEKVWPAP
mgnify:CR=1 FL=1